MGRSFLMLVLVSAVTAGTYLFMYFVIGPKLPVTTSEVPALSGLTVDQARALLEPRALVLVLDGEKPDDKVPPGTITHQVPLASSRLHRGGEVHGFVATAAPPTVPNLVGMTLAEAQNELGDVNLKPGAVTQVASDTVLVGQVAATTPPAGAGVKPGAVVDLAVSNGPSAGKVPRVVGKSKAKAREILEGAGFVVGSITFGSNDDMEQGMVIKQNPAADAPAARGAKVDLVVND